MITSFRRLSTAILAGGMMLAGVNLASAQPTRAPGASRLVAPAAGGVGSTTAGSNSEGTPSGGTGTISRTVTPGYAAPSAGFVPYTGEGYTGAARVRAPRVYRPRNRYRTYRARRASRAAMRSTAGLK